jgi:hypothetical protein
MVNLSPALLSRIDAIDGCQGRWILDNRKVDGNYSFAMRSIGETIPTLDGTYQFPKTVTEAAELCARYLWRGPVLLWQSDYLDADCSWSGCYSAPSIYQSNNRVFTAEYSKELEYGADGDGPGLSLDIRYVTAEMIETLHGLEQYPLIDEDDHSNLEMELQEEEWESWAAREWRDKVVAALDAYAPENAEPYWAEEHMDKIEDDKLRELFHACADVSNTYWYEESGSGYFIDMDRVASAIDRADLVDLTGLPLLSPDQEWRREPYPWPGAEPSPLAPSLPLDAS